MNGLVKYSFLILGYGVCHAQLQTISAEYEYDNLNRLVQVVSNGETTRSYTYDNLGNRLDHDTETDDGLTYVPDDAFEQELIDLGLDDVMDDYVVTNNINTLTTINLEDLGIVDATGIEDFSELEELFLDGNELSELNIETLSNLVTLQSSSNNLTDITLPSNSSLDLLWVSANQLTEIDLSQQSFLFNLQCIDNNLSSLDLSGNPILELLRCNANNIPVLDLSQNTEIRFVDTSENELTALLVPDNPDLYHLDFRENDVSGISLGSTESLRDFLCSDNELISLDFQNATLLEKMLADNNALEILNVQNGNNDILNLFSVINNPDLFCIQVDDEDAANASTGVYGDWEVDSEVVYSESCTLGLNDTVENSDIIITPNPTSGIIQVKLSNNLIGNQMNYDIIDNSGKILTSGNFETEKNFTTIDINKIPSGTYFLVLSNSIGEWTKRIIKL